MLRTSLKQGTGAESERWNRNVFDPPTVATVLPSTMPALLTVARMPPPLSSLKIVARDTVRPSSAPVADVSVTVNVSLGSTIVSPLIVTGM